MRVFPQFITPPPLARWIPKGIDGWNGGPRATFSSPVFPGVRNIAHATSGTRSIQYRWSGSSDLTIWPPIYSPNAQTPFFAPFADQDRQPIHDHEIEISEGVLGNYEIRAVYPVIVSGFQTYSNEIHWGLWEPFDGSLIRHSVGGSNPPLGQEYYDEFLYQIRRASDHQLMVSWTVGFIRMHDA